MTRIKEVKASGPNTNISVIFSPTHPGEWENGSVKYSSLSCYRYRTVNLCKEITLVLGRQKVIFFRRPQIIHHWKEKNMEIKALMTLL